MNRIYINTLATNWKTLVEKIVFIAQSAEQNGLSESEATTLRELSEQLMAEIVELHETAKAIGG